MAMGRVLIFRLLFSERKRRRQTFLPLSQHNPNRKRYRAPSKKDLEVPRADQSGALIPDATEKAVIARMVALSARAILPASPPHRQ
jgi:hypothetical protein